MRLNIYAYIAKIKADTTRHTHTTDSRGETRRKEGMTIFEQEASKTEAGRNYEFDNENVLEWITGDKTATVTLSQKRLISRVEKLAQEHPEEVQIVHRNRTSIVAHIPAAYIKLNPPLNLSEEQRSRMSQAMNKIRENQAKSEG